jgi:hypothetical protein
MSGIQATAGEAAWTRLRHEMRGLVLLVPQGRADAFSRNAPELKKPNQCHGMISRCPKS